MRTDGQWARLRGAQDLGDSIRSPLHFPPLPPHSHPVNPRPAKGSSSAQPSQPQPSSSPDTHSSPGTNELRHTNPRPATPRHATPRLTQPAPPAQRQGRPGAGPEGQVSYTSHGDVPVIPSELSIRVWAARGGRLAGWPERENDSAIRPRIHSPSPVVCQLRAHQAESVSKPSSTRKMNALPFQRTRKPLQANGSTRLTFTQTQRRQFVQDQRTCCC